MMVKERNVEVEITQQAVTHGARAYGRGVYLVDEETARGLIGAGKATLIHDGKRREMKVVDPTGLANEYDSLQGADGPWSESDRNVKLQKREVAERGPSSEDIENEVNSNNEPLPADFPHRKELEDAGITTIGAVRRATPEDLKNAGLRQNQVTKVGLTVEKL
jgi:hypothetical protein